MTGQLYSKCWTQETIDCYFTSEAMSKTREAFNKVHVPIDRIRVDSQYPAGQGRQEISERELRDIVRASRPDQSNRIFLIVGDTGSGKSELCQWLNYNIGDAIHVPILIERRMIHLREIVEQIHQHLGEPLPSDMIEITDLWPETVSAKLRAAVLMRLQQSHVQNALGTANIMKLRDMLDTPDFEGRMRKHFQHYRDEIERLDKARQLQLLPEQDFKDLVIRAGGLRDTNLAYRHVQHAMSDCLASELGVEDLITKLGRISQRYQAVGKRPVLLIEDITTFGFLQNDLLDYLYNLAGGHFDVVMGVTTGFEQENETQIYKAQQTITERIQGRFELTDQHNETLFLREHFIELANRYLIAIRTNGCAGCPGNSDCLAAFDQGLYPFNRAFIGNIYRSLHQGQSRKQTPRLYLHAMQSVLESEQLPSEAIELSPNVSEPGIFFAQIPGLDLAAERLLKWYGLNTNAGVFLSRTIAKTFGQAFPVETPVVGDYYQFPLRPGAETELPPPPDIVGRLLKTTPASPQRIPTTGTVPTPAPTAMPPPKPSPIGQLDEWLAFKGQFPDRNDFKEGVYDLLQFYQLEPFVIRHPDSIADSGAPLLFERGEKYAKIYLHHSADDRPYPKLTIVPDAKKRDLYSQVLAIGTNAYSVTDAVKVDHAHLHHWLSSAVNEVHRELRQTLAQSLRMSLESFIAVSKFLLLNLTSVIDTLDAATVCRPIVGEPLRLNGLGDRGQHFWENRDHLQAVFAGLFHFRDNLVNYPLLKSTVDALDLRTALREIERINVDVFPGSFRTKIGGSELPFGHLVKVVREYVAFVNARVRNRDYQLQPSEDMLSQILDLCSPRGSADSSRLRKQLDDLKNLVQRAHVPWQQRWELSLQPLHRDAQRIEFDRLHDQITMVLDALSRTSHPLDIFAYLAFQRQASVIAGSSAFEVLQAIIHMQEPVMNECLVRTSRDPKNSKTYRDYRRAFDALQETITDGRS